MNRPAPVLEACRVSHSYTNGKNRIQAADTLDLRIDRGDFLSIVGPSGCGKTTLLRILAGLEKPESGQVMDQGAVVEGPDWRRSLVFQQPNLFPWLTVEENISFGPKNRGLAPQDYKPRVEELIRLVKLEEFRNAYPRELSGGMEQRVALARGLANEPHILLLDEPLGALDALTREHMQEELRNIWKRTGCTVVLVTHSVEEALYLSTRVIVLSKRPARIIAELPAPFSRENSNGKGRVVKSSPEFLSLREEVLEYIWEK